MKSILTFGSGVLTFLGALALLSLLLSISYITEQPTSEQLLILAAAFGPAIVMACLSTASFFLGTKRFGQPTASAPVYWVGVLCALLIFVGLILLSPLQSTLPPPIHFAAQAAVTFIVCFFAASKIAPRAG